MNPIPSLPSHHYQAQFTALKDQISPHFLFNSLSVLSALVRRDPDLAEQFIDQLARVYRYLLEHRDTERVTLEEELDFARSYAFLLEVRFGRRFKVNIPTAPAWQHYTLLPFTLQLLIENAIRHNRMSAADPLVIDICLCALEQGSCLSVCNNRQIRSRPDGGRGHGLAGIQHRYAQLTGRLVQVLPEADCFTVNIPLSGQDTL
ncbi:hypothetical protein GCM10023189_06770 [Nibrella saemangeumensis]|uniref:Signal transduction histidine kinase internal region domain-containing protein n=2 Tax=Nibrella saemangeumensis TaxID=1084526 RepID=A0ABP8MF93_9BACT